MKTEKSIEDQIKLAKTMCKIELIGALIITVLMIIAFIVSNIQGWAISTPRFDTLFGTMLGAVAFLCATASIYYTDLQILKLKKTLEENKLKEVKQ